MEGKYKQKNNNGVEMENFSKNSRKGSEKLPLEEDDVTVAMNPPEPSGDVIMRAPAAPDDELQYHIDDTPPWYLAAFLGFQHYLIMFGATLVQPLVLAPFLCIGDDDNLAKSYIIGTIFFVSGISTLLQTTIGLRLPIVQGGTFTFIAPAIAIMSLPKWQCPAATPSGLVPAASSNTTMSSFTTSSYMTTDAYLDANMTANYTEPLWMPRMREIQGAIMVASLFQVVIGSLGVVGWLLRYIGPLAVTPTISLIGLGLFDVASNFASSHWWIAFLTVGLIVLFSQFLKNVTIPIFCYQKGQGCGRRAGFPLFKLFPVLLAITISWLLCGIFTWTNVFPNDPSDWQYGARTDRRLQVLQQAPYFRLPYPGQWGVPSVSAGAVLGMLAGVLASMIESVGDYYACARIAQVPPPPMHAVNRGILMEGIGCILAGGFGTGTGTTSYSENIGAIGITKNASRRVLQYGAVVMMLFGLFGKFGALFVTIPDPIVGGVFIVTFGMITAVGLVNLQFVDMNSSRNVFILGFSIFIGLTVPKWVQGNPTSLLTGSEVLDQIVTVLLSTPMFVGGFSGFLLDNTVPGTDEERGIIKWRAEAEKARESSSSDAIGKTKEQTSCYDIPLMTKCLRRQNWPRYVPFLPTFNEQLLECSCCKKKEAHSQ